MNLHEYICIDIENKITSKKERDFIEEKFPVNKADARKRNGGTGGGG